MFFSSLKNCKSCHRNQKHWAFQPSGHPTAVSGHLTSVRSYTTLHSRVYIGKCTGAVCRHNGSQGDLGGGHCRLQVMRRTQQATVVWCSAVRSFPVILTHFHGPMPQTNTLHQDIQISSTLSPSYMTTPRHWTLYTKNSSVHSIQQAQYIVRSIQEASTQYTAGTRQWTKPSCSK